MAKTIACACGAKVVPHLCGALDCPRCGEAKGKERGARVGDRLLRRRDPRVPVVQVVATVPPELRELAADLETWKRWRRAWHRALKRLYGERTWGFTAMHPAGDKTPERFAPHTNDLLVPSGKWFVEVNLLRAEWKRIIGAKREPQVHVSFCREPAKVKHRARYVARAFPGWHWWLPNGSWWGPVEERPALEENDEVCCRDCGEPFRVVDGPYSVSEGEFRLASGP